MVSLGITRWKNVGVAADGRRYRGNQNMSTSLVKNKRETLDVLICCQFRSQMKPHKHSPPVFYKRFVLHAIITTKRCLLVSQVQLIVPFLLPILNLETVWSFPFLNCPIVNCGALPTQPDKFTVNISLALKQTTFLSVMSATIYTHCHSFRPSLMDRKISATSLVTML